MATVFVAGTPARAELTEEQKAKVRAALPVPHGSFGYSFGYRAKTGFYFTGNESKTEELQAQLASLTAPGVPKNDAERARHLKSVGDLQDLLEDKRATATYAEAETLALAMAKVGKPADRARFLALAADYAVRQDKPDAAQVMVNDALKLSDTTWQAWQAQASVYQNRLFAITQPPGATTAGNEATEQWLASSPAPEVVKRARDYAAGSVTAVDKAIVLQEKSVPDAKRRSFTPYLSRIMTRATATALVGSLDAPAGSPSVSFTSRMMQAFRGDKVDQDMAGAVACEPDNPYAIATAFVFRAGFSESQKEMEPALRSLAARLADLGKKSLPDQETRVRLLEVQTFAYVGLNDWTNAAEKAGDGYKLEPNREVFAKVYPVALIKMKRFADAEAFAEIQVARQDTTANRITLAWAQVEQNDLSDAERTILPAFENDKSTATPALFLLAVRLKATTPSTNTIDWESLETFLQAITTDHSGEMTREEGIQANLSVAALYLLNGNETEAKSYLDAVLSSDSDNEAAKALLALLP